jgi:hypothetical protein
MCSDPILSVVKPKYASGIYPSLFQPEIEAQQGKKDTQLRMNIASSIGDTTISNSCSYMAGA